MDSPTIDVEVTDERGRAMRGLKRWVAALVAVAAGVSGASFASSAGADELSLAAEPGAVRLFGPDRYATSAAIAERMATVYCTPTEGVLPLGVVNNPFDRLPVIIASGENFPDGLAAAGLAARRFSVVRFVFSPDLPFPVPEFIPVPIPVLLTPSGRLDASTVAALNTINTLCRGDEDGLGAITIVGGQAAVSSAVQAELVDLIPPGSTINRLGGPDRYATAIFVADRIGPAPTGVGSQQQIFLATGTNFPDALSAGSLAAAAGIPILLNQGASLRADVADWIDGALNPGDLVWVMGGAAAVPASVEDELIAAGYVVRRVAGADRFATAALFAETLNGSGELLGLGNVVLVSGESFADALSAGPFAGFAGAPLLLTQRGSLPAPIEAYLSANAGDVSTVWAAGGRAAVSDEVVATARAAATTPG